LSDPSPEVRIDAVRALVKHDILEPEIFVPLLLRDGVNPGPKMTAIITLGELGSAAREAVPWLRSLIDKRRVLSP
jgi:hypothetical protein